MVLPGQTGEDTGPCLRALKCFKQCFKAADLTSSEHFHYSRSQSEPAGGPEGPMDSCTLDTVCKELPALYAHYLQGSSTSCFPGRTRGERVSQGSDRQWRGQPTRGPGSPRGPKHNLRCAGEGRPAFQTLEGCPRLAAGERASSINEQPHCRQGSWKQTASTYTTVSRNNTYHL